MSAMTETVPVHTLSQRPHRHDTVDLTSAYGTPSDISALDGLQSPALGSSVSMHGFEQEQGLSTQNQSVTHGPKDPVGPSPLRHVSQGQETGIILTAEEEISPPNQDPKTTSQQYGIKAPTRKGYQTPEPLQQRPQHLLHKPRPKPLLHRPGPKFPPGAKAEEYVIPLPSLGQGPSPIDCPYCHKRSTTEIELVSGDYVTKWAIILCALTGGLCAWLPCVMDCCKDAQHRCDTCNAHVATVTKYGSVQVRHPPMVRSAYAHPQQQRPKAETEQVGELDAVDNKIIGHEADGVPQSELGRNGSVVRPVFELGSAGDGRGALVEAETVGGALQVEEGRARGVEEGD